jgi:predicted site-specific integrase-resolvase
MHDNHSQKFLPARLAVKELDISYSTLKRWERQGRIETCPQNSTNTLYKVHQFKNIKQVQSPQKFIYARVSTRKQYKDLQNQIDSLTEQFPSYQVVQDIGSGLNWKRKGFTSLLDKVFDSQVSEIVVAHKDRLSRFAFELLQFIFEKYKVKLVVFNQNSTTHLEEFSEDLLSVITVFTARYYGKRKYSHAKQKTQTLSQHRSKKNPKEVDGNSSISLQPIH